MREPHLCYMKQNQKLHIKTKKGINREKRSKALSAVKPVQNISKNLQSALDVSSIQKEVFLSYKLQDHVYE